MKQLATGRRHITRLGEFVSVWNGDLLHTLKLRTANDQATSPRGEDAPVAARHAPSDRLDAALADYCAGDSSALDEIQIDLDGITAFTRRVYRACREIEFGRRATYQQLAHRAGSPGAARAVGMAMSRNRILLVIPCHRVVGKDGTMRGFSASGGVQTKLRWLDHERCGGLWA